MYDKQQYRDWYEKTKPQRKIWQKEYYQKHREHILKVHKDWGQKNVDQAGSAWRKFSRNRRIRNPDIDKRYRLRRKALLMYKPLPDSLTIKTSKVNGLGLFAKKDIAQGTNFGMTHLKIGDTIFRTPLGGFINHSDAPNCDKAELRMTSEDLQGHQYHYKKWNLITGQEIKKGEELTLKYTFYNV